MLTPDEIVNRRFLVALRGYDRDEVTAFQQEVARQVTDLQARIAELETQLERQAAVSSATAESAETAAVDPRAALRQLGEETTRILVAAEESAEEIEAKANARAKETVDTAQARSREIVDRANGQAARTVAEAERRRDAIATEIARLGDERDAFTQALRTAVQQITSTVTGLDEAPSDEASAPEPSPEPTPVPVQPDPPTESTEAPEPETPEPRSPHPDPESEPAEPQPEPAEPEPAEPEPAEPEPEASEAPDVAEEPGEAEPSGPPQDSEVRPSVAGRRSQALDGLRPDLVRLLKRGLQDVQNEVLASIREKGGRAELDDLLPAEGTLEDLGATAQTQLADAYRGALGDAAAEVEGDTPEQLADGARVPSAVATFRAVLAHEVTSSLRATLRAGLEAGEPEPQLSERVGEVFRDLRGPVIESLAEEHLHRVYSHGLLDAWQRLGVERIRWQPGDEPRCPENRCRTNAADGVVEIGIDFPSGDRVPPAHPGCTCTIVPV